MNPNTSIARQGETRLGIMVRSGTSLHVYWEDADTEQLSLRLTDLSGRPSGEILDGTGLRVIGLTGSSGALEINDLQPGHIYHVELGSAESTGFQPRLAGQPVQTPWPLSADQTPFPAPYHRS